MSKKSNDLRVESQLLLIDYYYNPSTKTRNKIVVLNAGLVRVAAHRISKMCPESYQDLEQIGYMGLMNAISRFNPLQGNSFSTYAIPCIDGAIKHFLRDRARAITLPRRLEELYKKGEKVRKILEDRLGRSISDLEIADHLQITLIEWREAMKIKNANVILSLDVAVTQLEGSTVLLGDSLSDEMGEIIRDSNEEYQSVRHLVSSLDLKFRQVLEFVYLKGLPRKEAAKLIGVSPMTVSRRLEIALRQMRELYNIQVTSVQ